jgi:tetratricopeptide (TPR) repeat protein
MKDIDSPKKALIIGISSYDKLDSLEFCDNDSLEMSNLLHSLGYQINYTLSGHVKWDKMRDAIYDFFGNDKTTKHEDTLLFYYSGHGIPDVSGDMYLSPSEIDPYLPSKRGFNFNELTKLIQNSIAGRKVIILDCCYSGAAKVSKGHEDDAAKLGTSAIERQFNALGTGEGVCLMAAGQAYQEAYALEEKNHSLFTYYLLEGLRGIKEATEANGFVTVDSLSRYVYNAIMSLPSDRRLRQKPIRKVEASGDIILAYYPQFIRTTAALGTISPSKSLDTEKLIKEGNEFLQAKEYQKALDHFQLVIRDPNYADAWNNIAIALAHLGKAENAIRSFDNATEISPDNAQLWRNKARYLISLGRHDECIEPFDKALSLEPNDATSWWGKGMGLQKMGRTKEALECYDKAIEKNSESIMAYYCKGDLFSELGKIEEAIECFNTAAKLEPNAPLPWFGKGRELRRVGKNHEAIQCFDRAIENFYKPRSDILVSGLDAIWNIKGLSLLDLEKIKEAIDCFDMSIQIDPTKANVLYNKATAIARQGRFEEAIEFYDKAIKINPDYDSAWEGKASAYNNLGKSQESQGYFDKAIELNPMNINSWNNKATSLFGLGRFEEAIECLNKALDIDSNQAILWANKGESLHKLGRYSEAVECYDKSLSLNPSNDFILKEKEDAAKSIKKKRFFFKR